MFNIVISRWRETYEGLKETKDYKTLSAAGSLMKNMVRECVFCKFYNDSDAKFSFPNNPWLHAHIKFALFLALKRLNKETREQFAKTGKGRSTCQK